MTTERAESEEAGTALDEESPGDIRRAFVWITALAGVVLLLPRQWWSAVICFAFSAAILVAHLVLRRRGR